MYIAAQIVGIVAVSTFLLSYQLKQRNHIVLVNGMSSVLYVLQYILLGAFEGAAIDTISAVSTFVAAKKEKKYIQTYAILLMVLFDLAIFAAGMALYRNVFSLCSIAGALLQVSALWLSRERNIRLVSFLGTPFWLVFNLTSHAYGAAVGSFLSMVSVASAIFRYDIYPKLCKNKHNAST